MKTLVILTGRDVQVIDTWLPTIRKRGQYDGDILFIDFDLQQSSLEILRKDPKITIVHAEKAYGEISSDRIRVFYERLKDVWKNYDVILMTDADLEFFKPIASLFEMAKEKLCYVQEPKMLGDNSGFNYSEFDFPEKDKIWSLIKNEPMINVGVLVGPAKIIYDVLGWITQYLVVDHHWGADQLLINALIYYYKTFPTQAVPLEWNFLAVNGYVTIKDKLYDQYGNEMAILHRIGTTLIADQKHRKEETNPKTFSGVKYSRPPKFK